MTHFLSLSVQGLINPSTHLIELLEWALYNSLHLIHHFLCGLNHISRSYLLFAHTHTYIHTYIHTRSFPVQLSIHTSIIPYTNTASLPTSTSWCFFFSFIVFFFHFLSLFFCSLSFFFFWYYSTLFYPSLTILPHTLYNIFHIAFTSPLFGVFPPPFLIITSQCLREGQPYTSQPPQ